MFTKLDELKKRYDFLSEKLADNEVIADMVTWQKYSKEQSDLTETVEKYVEYLDVERQMNDAFALSETETDGEMKKMLLDEGYDCKNRLADIKEELKILLLPKDKNDERSCILEVRAGTGGEEAALFAAVLFRMYSMYAESCGFKISLMNANETELGGYREIPFMVEGDGVYSRFKFESGVHRVQRVPETESQGRIQTSTATVAVLPEVEEVDVVINPADLEIETCKSSGAGGQHINKTESAIRIIHKPSGIVVECQEERSQFKNKDKAMKLLRAKLYDIEKTKRDTEIADERRRQVGTGDRSERIRTYNFPQGRVTDHRIGLTLYTLDTFMNGKIEAVVNALVSADTAEKLSHMNQHE